VFFYQQRNFRYYSNFGLEVGNEVYFQNVKEKFNFINFYTPIIKEKQIFEI